jgi:uncharacterized membrane protein
MAFPVPGGLSLLYAVLFLPPVFFFVFGCVVVWAVSALVRFVDRRTPLNIGLAVAGLVWLVVAARWWYVSVALAKGPLP